VAEAPDFTFPHGSFASGAGPSTSSTASLVTPWIVRSPVTFHSPSAPATFFETNVIAGNFSTSRKSALFRCASRCSSRVWMVVASMLASTREFSGAPASNTTVPVTLENSPRTLDTIRCRTLNPAVEWTGSIVYLTACLMCCSSLLHPCPNFLEQRYQFPQFPCLHVPHILPVHGLNGAIQLVHQLQPRPGQPVRSPPPVLPVPVPRHQPA